MEISGIRSSMPFLFKGNEKEHVANVNNGGMDKVDLRTRPILADDEVDGVLNETISMIGNDGAAALSVHSGLTESRVFSLLGF